MSSWATPAVKAGVKRRLVAGDPPPAWLKRHPRCAYLTRHILSVPYWVKYSDFDALRLERLWASVMHNELHCLDHIVPLSHPLVCGLTVPWNLRVVSAKANTAKGNNWLPGQMELL